MSAILFSIEAEAFIFISTALKPLVFAALYITAKSRPALLKTSTAFSLVIHPSSCINFSPLSVRTISNCGPVQEELTVDQG